MIIDRQSFVFIVCLSFGLLLLSSSGTAIAGEDGHSWSAFAYGGRWSDNRIGEILQASTRLRSTHVWAAGISRKVHDFSDKLLLEVELNVARHTGRQDHFEFNAAANLRWQSFPWDRYVNSTLSYGLGPSYATRRPPIEQRSDRGPTHVLVFMPVEITFGPPEEYDASWETLLRIHHRSGAYGIVSDARGSNFITVGLRYRF